MLQQSIASSRLRKSIFTSNKDPVCSFLPDFLCVCVYTCVCMCMCVYVCVCMHVYVYVCAYIMCVCVHVCMCMCMYMCTYVCVFVCQCVHMCVCVCVCVCVRERMYYRCVSIDVNMYICSEKHCLAFVYIIILPSLLLRVHRCYNISHYYHHYT